MDDSIQSDSELKSHTLEFTPAEILTLYNILTHVSMGREDNISMACKNLSLKFQSEMFAESFQENLNRQYEEVNDEIEKFKSDFMPTNVDEKGFQ